MKSAMDIALEKADRISGIKKDDTLTDEQKKTIAEIRNLYKGKIAEKEIMTQSEINKLNVAAVADPAILQIISEKQNILFEEKEMAKKEMEDKISEIKKNCNN